MSGVGPKRVRSNFRVEILVPSWTSPPFGFRPSEEIPEAEQERRARDLLREVRRHVDDTDQAAVVWDTATVCNDCGWPWEGVMPDDDPDLPGLTPCCGKPPAASSPLEGTQA